MFFVTKHSNQIKRRQTKLGKNNNLSTCQSRAINHSPHTSYYGPSKLNLCAHSPPHHIQGGHPKQLAQKERCVCLCPLSPNHPPQSGKPGSHSLLGQFSTMLKQLLCGGQVSLRVWNSLRGNSSCLKGESSLLSSAGNSNNLVLPFKGFILLFSNCPIQS